MKYTEITTSLVLCSGCSCAVPTQAMTSHSVWHDNLEVTAQRAYNAAADRIDG